MAGWPPSVRTGSSTRRAVPLPVGYAATVSERRPRSGDSDLPEAAAQERAASRLVHETARRRDTAEGVARWHEAIDAWRGAMSRVYPPAFMADLERVRSGDPAGVDSMIRFLEADPWAFRSGYLKATILQRLRHVELATKQKARLAAVILDHVDHHDRRESRHYYGLAPFVADDHFRNALLTRLRAGGPGRRRRALWTLEAIAQPLGPGDDVIARQIAEDLASFRGGWRSVDWLRHAVRRYADAAWLEDLVERGAGHGKAADAARILLYAGLPRLSPEQRARLDEAVERERSS